ncbi:two-partner secretion domain-containing protein [Cupriavidus basilensis]
MLNRVNDPSARPSRIQGQIKGDGTVMIVNRNGIMFTGSSQVDTRNLVAAAARIDDDQFRSNGIFSSGTAASFTNAQGRVDVQAGARITAPAPGKSTEGGGYVLLLGEEVRQRGRPLHAEGPGRPGGGRQLCHQEGRRYRRQPGLDHPRQRGQLAIPRRQPRRQGYQHRPDRCAPRRRQHWRAAMCSSSA